MKKTANIYHHTHWDNEWYFTEEDSMIQLTYHMKELLHALEEHVIDYFYLDGQTAILEDYLSLHEEDEERVKQLMQDERLFAGPFHTQIDSFITNGESVINNLRYGMNYADRFGGTSRVAYLPDSFGQSQDYPKIFQQLGIDSFVFRRGMGDEHDLPLDFVYRSNDGSSVVASTLNCGYGFATEPFINQRLTKDAGLDYDGKDIASQLKKLADLSTLDNEFLLPIGNDQTPVIWNFKELLAYYQDDETYEFIETTLANYMDKLKKNTAHMKTYEGEFINPQYHRVHRSISSARMDIKNLQGKLENLMALEIQPIMTILEEQGLAYDKKLVDRIWGQLGRSQTHSGATNTDKTNDLILTRTQKAYNLAEALKVYLIRKVAISLSADQLPIVFFNTLPYDRKLSLQLDIYTRNKNFGLTYQKQNLAFTQLAQEKIYGGVVRKEIKDHDEALYFYKTTIITEIKNVPSCSYNTIYVDETKSENNIDMKECTSIENQYFSIRKAENDTNGFTLFIKDANKQIENFIFLEESGDEGDNYDYSYPTKDMINTYNFHDCTYSFHSGKEVSTLKITGKIDCPSTLEARESALLDNEDTYQLEIKLINDDPVISVKGTYDNHAKNHRVRLIIKTPYTSTHSIAGTQFGFIERENTPTIMNTWKKEGWLEEPSPIYPLLNYVMSKEENKGFGVFTKSSKEYEMIGESYDCIAITMFRSVGHLGLPDLNRRPGRASGLAEKIIPTPHSQMMGENDIEIGIFYMDSLNMNRVVNEYNEFATETCYYQNQPFNRVVYPISYFHTNPLVGKIPDFFQLKMPKEMETLAFSTLEIEHGKKIVRYFHNGEPLALSTPIIKHDLFANEIGSSATIKTGEIVNVEVRHEK